MHATHAMWPISNLRLHRVFSFTTQIPCHSSNNNGPTPSSRNVPCLTLPSASAIQLLVGMTSLLKVNGLVNIRSLDVYGARVDIQIRLRLQSVATSKINKLMDDFHVTSEFPRALYQRARNYTKGKNKCVSALVMLLGVHM